MNEIAFIILIGGLGVVSTFYSSKGGLYDLRYKGFERINRRGWAVIGASGAIVILSIIQLLVTQAKNEREKQDMANQKRIDDSTLQIKITQGVDSSRKALFRDLSEALEKQKLKLDTVNKDLVAIRDSARSIVNNFPEDMPALVIPDGGINVESKTDTSFRWSFFFSSFVQASANVDVSGYVIITMKFGKTYTTPFKLPIRKGGILAKEEKSTVSFNTRLPITDVADIKIYAKGNYTSLSGKLKAEVDELYEFNIDKNEIVIFTEPYKTNYLKRMGFIK